MAVEACIRPPRRWPELAYPHPLSVSGSAPKKKRKKETKQRAPHTSPEEMQRLKDALAAKGLGTTGNAQQLQARLSRSS
eukprot:7383033-Prymnesium_polylepis.2